MPRTASRAHNHSSRPAARVLAACGQAARAYLGPIAAVATGVAGIAALTVAASAQDKGQAQPTTSDLERQKAQAALKAKPPQKSDAQPSGAEADPHQAEMDRLKAEVQRQQAIYQQNKPAQPQAQPQPVIKPAPTRPNPAPVQPAGKPGSGAPNTAPAPAPAPRADGDVSSHDGMFTFNFNEPIDITVLIDDVRDELNLQIIATDNGLKGQTVVLTAPITVPVADVLPFVNMLLEQKDYTLTRQVAGVYVISPRNGIPPNIGPAGDGNFYSTRIIPTPGIKPSSLQAPITNLVTTNRAGGVPGGGPVYMDDVGVIVITDSPRVTAVVEDFVNRIVQERRSITPVRFPLEYVAASSARDRVLELISGGSQRSSPGVPGQQPGVQAPSFAGASISNLPERLTVDASSNALIFRGRPDEGETLAALLRIVDVPTALVSRWYESGTSTAEAVAQEAKRQQLGDVTYFESTDDTGAPSGAAPGIGGAGARRPGQPGQPGLQNQPEFTGAGFIIYPQAGGFMYRGTEQQHARIADLVRQLADLSRRDEVSYEFYKLKHNKAENVAEIIQNIISNTVPTGNRGGLLGRDLGGSRRTRNTTANRSDRSNRQNANQGQPRPPNAAAGGAGTGADASGVGELEGADVFVLADESNNQVLVKAPKRLQKDFLQLINNLDIRRPQVYITAQIVAVNETDSYRLAVEAQKIIGQFAFQTNFGLAQSIATGGTGGTGGTTSSNFLSPKEPSTNLGGITAALIRSKDVPFIINALANDTNSRIVATPQLLIDDNEEAEIASLNQQPTLTQAQGTATTTTGFGGYEEAGPKLTVTPQISEGGYLKLQYDIELSSFTGDAPSPSSPPPRQKNNVSADSVTVPSDATIVVGGLTFDNVNDTVIKVPLLGDIPILGHLFRDTRKNASRTTLFIFITPRIMRDPNFADLRLITRMPLAEVQLDPELPPPAPVRMDVTDLAAADTNRREEEAIKRQRLDFDPDYRRSREGRRTQRQEDQEEKKKQEGRSNPE